MSIGSRYGVAAFFGVLLFAAASAHATSLDDLLAKNLQARGGADKVAAIKTLKIDGKLFMNGQLELHVTEYQKAPDKTRTDASLQGLTFVQAWNGKEAWRISPDMGRKDP
ncbi:MAG: hypothetical protein LBQ20_02270, partial [Rhodanobacter sp.]|nr:hypothetical protein [Rhodanobacter sp.]